MKWSQKVGTVGLAASLLAGVMSCLNMVGGKASLAAVITIYALGFGGGASLVAAVKKRK